MVVKLDEKTTAVIEEIINRRGSAVVSLRKGEIVIVEHKEKLIYRTTQSRE